MNSSTGRQSRVNLACGASRSSRQWHLPKQASRQRQQCRASTSRHQQQILAQQPMLAPRCNCLPADLWLKPCLYTHITMAALEADACRVELCHNCMLKFGSCDQALLYHILQTGRNMTKASLCSKNGILKHISSSWNGRAPGTYINGLTTVKSQAPGVHDGLCSIQYRQ